MKNYIIGTAGHIDHGKTSLIKALTGTDTDRLTEEKKRGISIVLGYAGLNLPSGAFAGIVDVPGHAKFIKTMVSGSSGMDAVIFVIAADDGIKPQTEEHLLILKLLDIKAIIPVLTKIDLANEKTVVLRESEIKGLFDRYSVPIDEIIKVSSKTGEGIETLVKKIDAKISSLNFIHSSTKTFLPVDRVFTLKGFGTILTGTLMYGYLSINDEIEIMPKNIVTKIKSIESHNKSIPVAKRSMRTAINIASVQKEDVDHGNVVSLKDSLLASDTILCSFSYVGSGKKDLNPKNLSNLVFMTGSVNLPARIIIPDKNKSKKISPGTRLTVIIKLKDKISTMSKEKFIVRDPGMLETIGGGTIIDPFLDYGYDSSNERFYQNIISRSSAAAILSFISINGNSADLSKIYKKMNFSYNDFASYVTGLIKLGRIVADEKLKFAALKENIAGLEVDIEEKVKYFIDKDRLKTSIPKSGLYSYYGNIIDISIFDMILNDMVSKGVIASSGGNISIKGAVRELSEENKKLMDKIELLVKSSGNSVPFVPNIEKKLNINKKALNNLIGIMVSEGRLIRVKYDILYLKEQIDKIKKDIELFFSVNAKLEPKDIKDIAGVSRKYAIPLLEYFDAAGFTIKKGNYRVKGA